MNGEGISLVGPSFPYRYVGGFTPKSVPYAGADGNLTEDTRLIYDLVNLDFSGKNITISAMNAAGNIYTSLGPDYLNSISPGTPTFKIYAPRIRLGDGNNPTSFVSIAGSFARNITIAGATPFNADVQHDIVFITTGAGAYVVNLPSATVPLGREYIFKKVDAGAGAITITPNGAETIDGAATYVLAAINKYVQIISDGTNWKVIANN